MTSQKARFFVDFAHEPKNKEAFSVAPTQKRASRVRQHQAAQLYDEAMVLQFSLSVGAVTINCWTELYCCLFESRKLDSRASVGTIPMQTLLCRRAGHFLVDLGL